MGRCTVSLAERCTVGRATGLSLGIVVAGDLTLIYDGSLHEHQQGNNNTHAARAATGATARASTTKPSNKRSQSAAFQPSNGLKHQQQTVSTTTNINGLKTSTTKPSNKRSQASTTNGLNNNKHQRSQTNSNKQSNLRGPVAPPPPSHAAGRPRKNKKTWRRAIAAAKPSCHGISQRAGDAWGTSAR